MTAIRSQTPNDAAYRMEPRQIKSVEDLYADLTEMVGLLAAPAWVQREWLQLNDYPIYELAQQFLAAVPMWFPRLKHARLLDQLAEARLLAFAKKISGLVETNKQMWTDAGFTNDEQAWRSVRDSARSLILAMGQAHFRGDDLLDQMHQDLVLLASPAATQQSRATSHPLITLGPELFGFDLASVFRPILVGQGFIGPLGKSALDGLLEFLNDLSRRPSHPDMIPIHDERGWNRLQRLARDLLAHIEERT